MFSCHCQVQVTTAETTVEIAVAMAAVMTAAGT